eukprot:15065678-Alexandrium_andersonii.AAC.1
MVYTALCAGLGCWRTSNAPPRRVPTRVSPRQASQRYEIDCARLNPGSRGSRQGNRACNAVRTVGSAPALRRPKQLRLLW